MDTFVDLLKSSSLVQGAIALACIGTIAYLYATVQPVPDTLVSITTLILGYYFGSKTQQAINKGIRDYASRNQR